MAMRFLQIGGSRSDQPLATSEFMHIAEQAVAMAEYGIALQWLAKATEQDDVTSAGKIRSLLLQATIYEKV